MNKTISLVLLAVAIAIMLCGWYLYSTQKALAPSALNTETSSAVSPETVVSYSAIGFSPKTITVKKGTAVTFKSIDGSRMWVGVNEHPTHLGYDGTSRSEHCPDATGTAFDQCSAGESFTFIFQKVGSWNYHNHAKANDEGVVIVTE